MDTLSVGLRLPTDSPVAQALRTTVQEVNEQTPGRDRTDESKLLTEVLQDPEVEVAVEAALDRYRVDPVERRASALEAEAAALEGEAQARASDLREKAQSLRERAQEIRDDGEA